MPSVSSVSVLGKYLDQPALVKKLYDKMPAILTASAAGYGAYDTYNSPDENKKKKAVKNASVLAFTVASALLATRGLNINGKQVFEGLIELPHLHGHDIEKVLAKVTDEKSRTLIEKVKNNHILKFSDVRYLMNNLNKEMNDPRAIKNVIPDAHNHGPFAELLNLSVLGLVPVIGGIAGGVVGDKLCKEDWKKQIPNKIKEGSYQYLNNIFLCNVGAGLGALVMNKFNVQSRAARFVAMLSGVVGVGLVAGSTIANFVGKNYINPLFDKSQKRTANFKDMFKNLNSERHPEALDLSLHIDDIASVGFVSGLKWIGPVLPMLYSVSGYRAGIGYRNGKSLKTDAKSN